MGVRKLVTLASGTLALVAGLSATSRAADFHLADFNVYPTHTDQHIANFITEGGRTSTGTDLTIFSGIQTVTDVGPLGPTVLGADLYGNQAVFQFGNSEFFQSTPLVLVNLDSTESWQNASLTSGSPMNMAEQFSAQLLSIDFPVGPGKFVVSLDQIPNTEIAPNFTGTQLDLPAVAVDLARIAEYATNLTDSTPADAGAPRQERARGKSSSISAPVSTPSAIPEPASIGIFGFVAAGLLGRRRLIKA